MVIKKIDANHHAYLACYLVPKDKETLDITSIKNSLKKFFPHYMIPKTYTIINTIPLTVNGKMDTSALPDPEISSLTLQKYSIENEAEDAEEEKLLLVWQKLLKNNHIEINDNFFEVGGHSLLAFQLLIDIKAKMRISLHIKDIFLYPSVSELAKQS